MQQYADIYLLQNYSTCFGRPSLSTSGVHKTVVAASGTDHTIWEASFFKRDQIRTFNLSLHLFVTGYVAWLFQCVLCLIFGGIFMNRLILLFYAKASVLCFNLSLFIRTTAFSLSASLVVILYVMNVVFELSDFAAV
jgi:hypothetical protein